MKSKQWKVYEESEARVSIRFELLSAIACVPFIISRFIETKG